MSFFAALLWSLFTRCNGRMLRADYSWVGGVKSVLVRPKPLLWHLLIQSPGLQNSSYCIPNPGNPPSPARPGQTFAHFSVCKYCVKFQKTLIMTSHSLWIRLLFKRGGVLTIRHQSEMWVCVESEKRLKFQVARRNTFINTWIMCSLKILHSTPMMLLQSTLH